MQGRNLSIEAMLGSTNTFGDAERFAGARAWLTGCGIPIDAMNWRELSMRLRRPRGRTNSRRSLRTEADWRQDPKLAIERAAPVNYPSRTLDRSEASQLAVSFARCGQRLRREPAGLPYRRALIRHRVALPSRLIRPYLKHDLPIARTA